MNDDPVLQTILTVMFLIVGIPIAGYFVYIVGCFLVGFLIEFFEAIWKFALGFILCTIVIITISVLLNP